MLTLTNTEITYDNSPDMTRAELDSEWRMAKDCFEQALAQKTEIDRVYVAAANRLNMLERVIKKVEQRAAVDRRAVARSLARVA